MFKLQPNPTFWAKVQIQIPGQEKPGQIEVQYKHFSRADLKAFFEMMASSEQKTDQEHLAEIVVGWRGVDAEFSLENLDKLLDMYPTAAKELFSAFSSELLEARVKN